MLPVCVVSSLLYCLLLLCCTLAVLYLLRCLLVLCCLIVLCVACWCHVEHLASLLFNGVALCTVVFMCWCCTVSGVLYVDVVTFVHAVGYVGAVLLVRFCAALMLCLL